MPDTPDFNTLPVDTPNGGKKVSGVMRMINAVNVFVQNVRIANEAADPVLVGGALLASLDAKTPALQGGAVPAQIIGPVAVGYIASNGVVIPADSLAATHTIVAGQITAITVSYLGINYVQTLTYTGGIVSAISNWVAQ